jgi:ribosome maturation factor RimP
MFAFEKLPGLPRDRIVEAIDPVLRAHGLVGVELIWRTDAQGRVLQVTLEKEASSDQPSLAHRSSGSVSTSDSASAPDGALDSASLDSASLSDDLAGADSSEIEEGLDSVPGAGVTGGDPRGVTLEVCSKVSRDLSTALDVLELIDGKYRLEVGSPGLERRLYTLDDYRRFSGRLAKLKLASAIEGQYVLLGKLNGLDAEDRVLIVVDVDGVEHASKLYAVSLQDVRSGQLAIDWQEMGFSPTPRQRAGRRSAAQGRK